MHPAIPAVCHVSELKALFSAGILLVLLLAAGSYDGCAAPVVITTPESERVAVGSTVSIAITVDMAGTGEQLGSYSLTLFWDQSVLLYHSISGGSNTGFTSVRSNADNAASGELVVNQFSTTGTDGMVHIATVTFTAAGSAGQTAVLTPSINALAASGTFTDLSGSATISAGSVRLTAPGVTLTDPNGGEVWYTGIDHPITWTASGLNAVALYYSLDNGSHWQLIVSSVNAAMGVYSWTPPPVSSDQCLVRVVDVQDEARQDRSNLPFTLIESGIWGDVDGDGSVTISDAVIIATYAVNPGHAAVAVHASRLESRGDVDASGTITAADAHACAVFEIDPDNASLPVRVGQLAGTVP